MGNKKWMIAPIIGLLAAGLHFRYINELKNEAVGGEKVKIIFAAEDIKTGNKITETQIASRMIPIAYVDDRAIRAERFKEIEGMIAFVDIKAGQTIMWSDFSNSNRAAESDLADLLESGNRAVTIPVNAALSMGGLLRPGHRVDILWTSGRDIGSDTQTATLLQNILILAVDKYIDSIDEEDKKRQIKTVTLSVNLEDAERLSLAVQKGSLSLALRGRQDIAIVQGSVGVSSKDLLGNINGNKPSLKLEKIAEKLSVIERIQKR